MPRGKPFQKGQSGNPGGKAKKDPLIAKFKATTYQEFLDCLQRYGSYTVDQMQQVNKDPKTTMFQKIFGTIIVNAAKGDKDSRQVLLERLWGKVKEQVEHLGGTDIPQITICLPPKKELEDDESGTPGIATRSSGTKGKAEISEGGNVSEGASSSGENSSPISSDRQTIDDGKS